MAHIRNNCLKENTLQVEINQQCQDISNISGNDCCDELVDGLDNISNQITEVNNDIVEVVEAVEVIDKKKEVNMEQIKNKRWVRGSRLDIVREGDKIYYRICKCGLEKESYKTSMCRSCNRDYLNERNRSKKKYDVEIKNLIRKGKGGDKTLDRKKNFWSNKLIEFVNRIERRNGLASMEDIFVDMITLFNYYGCNQDIDILPTGIQLQMMWEYLSDYKKKIEKNSKKSIK